MAEKVRLRSQVTALVLTTFAMISSANSETSFYPVEGFDRIYFSGSGTLKLVQGRAVSVQAQARPHVLQGLSVETSDGVLYVEAKPAGHRADELVVNITVRDLVELVSDGQGIIEADSLVVGDLMLEGKGAGKFSFSNLTAEELIITGHGSNAFDMSGEVARQVVEIHGIGQYQAQDLVSQEGEVSVMGSGDIVLWVQEMLEVRIGGAARVRYSGKPVLRQRIFGLGSVQQVPIAR